MCPIASETAFGLAPAESAVGAKPWRLSRARDNRHILLGHTAEKGVDRPDLPKTLIEAEAEAVVLLRVEALGLPGADYARGYIQLWYGSDRNLPEHSAQRIFKVADTILRAGRGAAPRPEVLRGIA